MEMYMEATMLREDKDMGVEGCEWLYGNESFLYTCELAQMM